MLDAKAMLAQQSYPIYRPNLIWAPAKCHKPLMKPWYSTASPLPVRPLLVSPVQYISVSRRCQGGYPSNRKNGPNTKRRSGSGFTEMGSSSSTADWDGCIVISVISASTNSGVMSWLEILPFCDISASVLVKSTKVSRPSVEERRRMVSDSGLDLSVHNPFCECR